jgi:hypothetical protein
MKALDMLLFGIVILKDAIVMLQSNALTILLLLLVNLEI